VCAPPPRARRRPRPADPVGRCGAWDGPEKDGGQTEPAGQAQQACALRHPAAPIAPACGGAQRPTLAGGPLATTTSGGPIRLYRARPPTRARSSSACRSPCTSRKEEEVNERFRERVRISSDGERRALSAPSMSSMSPGPCAAPVAEHGVGPAGPQECVSGRVLSRGRAAGLAQDLGRTAARAVPARPAPRRPGEASAGRRTVAGPARRAIQGGPGLRRVRCLPRPGGGAQSAGRASAPQRPPLARRSRPRAGAVLAGGRFRQDGQSLDVGERQGEEGRSRRWPAAGRKRRPAEASRAGAGPPIPSG